jgi:hypothetical protein
MIWRAAALQRTWYERCGDNNVHLSGLLGEQFLHAGFTLSSSARSANLEHFCERIISLHGVEKETRFMQRSDPTISASMTAGLISLASAHEHNSPELLSIMGTS